MRESTTLQNSSTGSTLLVINGGSSSVKFALFKMGRPLVRSMMGKLERIGLPDSRISVTDLSNGGESSRTISAPDVAAVIGILMKTIEQKIVPSNLKAIGHRVVHGGLRYIRPERVTLKLLEELRRLSSLDPEHLPTEIHLIEAISQRYPQLPQVACFDTAFHNTIPRVARLLPIPRRYEKAGVQRYGFHGLSYAYLMKELAKVGGGEEANGRVILAHLGNGASMAAVKGGKSIETTMGFTPTSGLPMSTRSGDLDPGLVSYLARTDGMTVEQFHEMVNRQSGLLGVSEVSSDMRDLLEREQADPRAAEAVALFCYQAKRWLGGLAAVLGGLDTLVFSGGIGENSPVIRTRICSGLEFLGVELDEGRNRAGETVISTEKSQVVVRVIRTDEEVEIGQSVYEILRGSPETRPVDEKRDV